MGFFISMAFFQTVIIKDIRKGAYYILKSFKSKWKIEHMEAKEGEVLCYCLEEARAWQE